jgi:hypothetical protein
MEKLIFKNDKCMARKNLNNAINTQCPYRKKYGHYCGLHRTNRLRIDEPLPSKYNLEPKKQGNHKLVLKLKIKNNNQPIDNKPDKLFTTNDYIRNAHKKGTIKDLRYTLLHYGLSPSGTKQSLLKRLETYFNSLMIYKPYIRKIVLIQRNIRKWLMNKVLKLRGPAYFKRHMCVNEYDFYTCDDKEDIPNDYFISYTDSGNFTYCFDVRSIVKLTSLANGEIPKNPFSLQVLPIEIITNSQTIIDTLKKENKFCDCEEVEMSADQELRSKIINLFHKMDELDNHTNVDWFAKLSLHKLRKLYKVLVDIWMHRAGLTNEIRQKIVPQGNIFKMTPTSAGLLKSKRKLQTILLKEMDTLISSAVQRPDRVLGSLYILTALCEVSKECADVHPWLMN